MQDQVQVCSGMQNDVCGCLEAMDATGWLLMVEHLEIRHATWEPTYWGHPKNVTNMHRNFMPPGILCHQNASKCIKMHQNATCWKSDSEEIDQIVLF